MTTIKEARLAAKLTQAELASKIGVDLRTLRRIENGESDLKKVTAATLLGLSEALNISLSDLLESSFPKHPKNSYKNFSQKYIGESDIASLTLRSPEGVFNLHFGGDGRYFAYICKGADVEIGDHYQLVYTAPLWLKIYDDTELVLNLHADELNGKIFDIYRAGDYGCIIHCH